MIETIGCQMNVCESDTLSRALIDKGAIKIDNYSEADIVILNTCSVRAQAEQKAFSFLGRVEDVKKVNKSLKVIVMGCMAERIRDKIYRRFKGVDLVVGTGGDFVKEILRHCGLDPQSHAKPLAPCGRGQGEGSPLLNDNDNMEGLRDSATSRRMTGGNDISASGLPRATRRPRNDDQDHDNDNKENGILNTPSASPTSLFNQKGNYDNDRMENGIEGFCASTSFHAE
jgi:hypothetical protein